MHMFMTSADYNYMVGYQAVTECDISGDFRTKSSVVYFHFLSIA